MCPLITWINNVGGSFYTLNAEYGMWLAGLGSIKMCSLKNPGENPDICHLSKWKNIELLIIIHSAINLKSWINHEHMDISNTWTVYCEASLIRTPLIWIFSYPDSQSGNRGVRISEVPLYKYDVKECLVPV